MQIFWKLATPWQIVYEGEGGEGGEGGGGEGGGGEGGGGTGAKKTFTQDDVNKMLAEDRRKHQAKVDANVKELEQLRKAKGLTEKEKETLTKQIEELKATSMSKEELAAKEQKRLKEEAEAKEKTLSLERDTWKNKYYDSTITRALQDGAVAAGAVKPSQIVTLLKGSTRLVEVLDADDQPTGDFIAKVKYDDVDKDGKPVTLDLTVPEVMKLMKGKPEEHGNLFESTLKGGLGGTSGKGGKQKDTKEMTPKEWAEHRKTLGLGRRSPLQFKRDK